MEEIAEEALDSQSIVGTNCNVSSTLTISGEGMLESRPELGDSSYSSLDKVYPFTEGVGT